MSQASASEKIAVNCPHCGQAYQLSAQTAGTRARCGACKAVFTVQAAGNEMAAPLPAAAHAREDATDAGVCPVCRTNLTDAGVECPACHTRYHPDCWEYNNGCAKYGCASSPATEKLTELEIPVGYWGQDEKECPACRNRIQAAALRCRFCGTVFSTARPQGAGEFHANRAMESDLPGVRKASIWLLVFSVLPCTAAMAALIGGIWYLSNRRKIAELPAQQAALPRIALGIALLQTVIIIVVSILYSFLGSPLPR